MFCASIWLMCFIYYCFWEHMADDGVTTCYAPAYTSDGYGCFSSLESCETYEQNTNCVNVYTDFLAVSIAGCVALFLCVCAAGTRFAKSLRKFRKCVDILTGLLFFVFLMALTILRGRNSGDQCSREGQIGCLYLQAWGYSLIWSICLLWPLWFIIVFVTCCLKSTRKKSLRYHVYQAGGYQPMYAQPAHFAGQPQIIIVQPSAGSGSYQPQP